MKVERRLRGSLRPALKESLSVEGVDSCPAVTQNAAWTTDIDFMFSPERAHMSDVRASFNESMVFNETYHVPASRTSSTGLPNGYSVSIAFVNFSAALLALTVRYAAVFWYTNKTLTSVFALQLLTMTLTSIFDLCGFSVLYKVCYNNPLYHNITLSLSCSAIVTLYLIGGFVVLVSTVTVFEYGSMYFHQKFKIVDRKHNPESYVKQTVIVHSGCRGYIPHTCATVCLVCMAICKGPVVFDLVTVYRLSSDSLVLTCVIVDVCYMLFWIMVWCGLTVKQQWKFKILDYVPLKKPVFMIGSRESIVKNPTFDSKRLEMDMLNVPRSRSPLPTYDGILIETHEPCPSEDDITTENSENPNFNETFSTDLDSMPSGGARRKTSRKNGARVTFQDTRNNSLSVDDRRARSRSRTPVIVEPNHVNVQVDVHTPNNVQNKNTDDIEQLNPTNVLLRQNSGSTPVPRDFRNSLGLRENNLNNTSACSDEASFSTISDQLPTLMSSFRDKVRESSKAANNYKEKRNILESSGSFGNDATKPNIDSLKRRSKGIDRQSDDSYLKVNLENLDLKNHICDSPLRAGVTDGPMRQNSSSGFSDDSKCSSFKSPTDLSPSSNSSINGGLSPETVPTGSNKLTNGRLDYQTDKDYLFPRPVHLINKKPEIGRRDSANYSLTSSQDTSSNESDHGQGGLCSQKQNGILKTTPTTSITTPISSPTILST
ncbi:hypothetical protein LOTGIDRAFT_231734 [Lottia gigantea]|uniref:Uncharacterized protein n=1 Tax=Lottia gigantea TaxID=225164 RepID=V4C5R5_LOTGI|nr:hypothetical protein LOTGIDRAFT_231734 [Lottia gigantea]ESO96949.1 hypothetical protein LOTGIDRAFT_231734 [Lottia gigantea]